MSEELIECKYCRGTGVIRVTFLKAKESMRHNRVIIDKNSTKEIPCTFCFGMCKVSPATDALIVMLGLEQT